MVNFGLQAAEIVSLFWGTPAYFNGFRVLVALLHGTVVVGDWVSAKLCGVEQRAPPIFGRAAITLGIGPHSSLNFKNAKIVRDQKHLAKWAGCWIIFNFDGCTGANTLV